MWRLSAMEGECHGCLAGGLCAGCSSPVYVDREWFVARLQAGGEGAMRAFCNGVRLNRHVHILQPCFRRQGSLGRIPFGQPGPAMRQCAAGAGLVSAEEAASIALDPDRDSQAGEREARQRIGQAMEVPGAPKGSLILDFFAEILYT